MIAEFAEDFTGTEIDRPELTNLIKLVTDRKIDAIICYKLDRLTRGGANHAGYFQTLFGMSGVDLILVAGRLDDSPEGQVMSAMHAAFAKREVKEIRERTLR